jgi:putative thioredoxin
MREVDYEEFDQMREAGATMLLDLFIEKCEPCKELMPILESLEPEFQKIKPGIEVIKMDILKNRRIYHELGLKKSPTVIYFEEGVEVDRIVLKQEPELYLKLVEGN